jgi:hypothetical protein
VVVLGQECPWTAIFSFLPKKEIRIILPRLERGCGPESPNHDRLHFPIRVLQVAYVHCYWEEIESLLRDSVSPW